MHKNCEVRESVVCEFHGGQGWLELKEQEVQGQSQAGGAREHTGTAS